MLKFRFWLARLVIGKHGMVANMTFSRGIEIRDNGQRNMIYGNKITEVSP